MIKNVNEIPGEELPTRLTNEPTAWLYGQYKTIRLKKDVPALRVHRGVGTAAAANRKLAWGSGSRGRWFAIGDVILTRSEYIVAHALPEGFSKEDECVLPIGAILNVGRCGPLFGHPGRALQAEWIGGTPPKQEILRGFRINRSGNA